ncbi:MAG: glycosyltransferase 87 family protein [Actinomycetota bacterium]|nr:glycosyltransferase 87 family protein [Actinomycetota bacterium]
MADLRRTRLVILAVALVALALKLSVAATTFGTYDVKLWYVFLHLVRVDGPIGIYRLPFAQTLYNHPPLIGYYLQLVNLLEHVGLAGNFTIRAVSSFADVATGLIVFELLRAKCSLRVAGVGAVLVVASPILFIISGYHGNTDPVFTMLTLLSLYLLTERSRPLLAGVAMALSLGVKVVPIVALPCLLVYAYRRGGGHITRYVIGLVAVSALYWIPAMVAQFGAVEHNVLGYAGLNAHEWGIGQLEYYLRNAELEHLIDGPGRVLIVIVCAAGPALLVWRRPELAGQGVAFALAGFLVLSPTFGTQYLAWAAAAVVLLSLRAALVFNLVAGILLFEVYTRWNGGLLWSDAAHATRFNSGERVFALLVWATLVFALVDGLRRLPARSGPSSRGGPGRRVPPRFATRR